MSLAPRSRGLRHALAWALSWLIRAWTRSLRLTRLGPPLEPGLVAFWHGDQLPLLRLRPPAAVAPVSASQDGQLQRRVLARLGIDAVEGSSSKGGLAAARGLLRALKQGRVALLAVDGPRGPRGEVKPGVVFLARRTGLPVFPVGVAVARGRRLRAWDRYLLPGWFTRTVVVVGEPLRFTPESELDAGCSLLATRIEAATRSAEEAC